MQIKVLKLGHSTRHIDVPAGSTVSEALKEAELGFQGYSLTLNGLGVGAETQVSEGDIVTLVPKVEGGGC
jgi:sulfur carrier protein ThiS